MYRDINQACTQQDCHDLNATISHPVGMTPSGKIPSDLPLSNLSRVTCLTCHDELNSSSELSDNRYWLRRSPGKQFCESCHQNTIGTSKAQSHWQFTTRAHLVSGEQEDVSFSNRNGIGQIDSESRNCLSCHDNLATIVADGHKTRGRQRQQLQGMANHAIGMNYEESARRQGSELLPQTSITTRIKFIDGQVGCGSCHSLYNDTPNHLVMSNKRSALCLSCHDK